MLNDKKGIALFLVFLIIGFASSLFIAVSIQVQNQAKITETMMDKECAFWTAQTGLNSVYYEEKQTNWSWYTYSLDALGEPLLPDTRLVIDEANLADPDVDGRRSTIVVIDDDEDDTPDDAYYTNDFYADTLGKGRFETRALQDAGNPDLVVITSTGTYNGQSITLRAVYEKTLFNKYFLYIDDGYSFTPGPSIEWNMGIGNMYIGGSFSVACGAWTAGSNRWDMYCSGKIDIAGALNGRTWESLYPYTYIDYWKSVGLDDAYMANRLLNWPAGKVYLNGVEIPTGGKQLYNGGIPLVGSYSEPPESYVLEAHPWITEHLDMLSTVIDPSNIQILNDNHAWKSQRYQNWLNFKSNYVAKIDNGEAGDFLRGVGFTEDDLSGLSHENLHIGSEVIAITPPDYTALAGSASIRIKKDGMGGIVVTDSIGNPLGNLQALIDKRLFYNPAYCYREDNWNSYPQAVRDAYAARASNVDTTSVEWLAAHDGSEVGSPVELAVIDTGDFSDQLPYDNAIIHSEVALALLGDPDISKTFTLICDDDLYIKGNFNSSSQRSITLMTRTYGCVLHNEFDFNEFSDYPPSVTLSVAGWPLAPHMLSTPAATDISQHALFIGDWESVATGLIGDYSNINVDMVGGFIRLPADETRPTRTCLRGSTLSDYLANVSGIYWLYPSPPKRWARRYNNNFFDNPTAGHIAGSRQLEWSIVR